MGGTTGWNCVANSISRASIMAIDAAAPALFATVAR